MVIYGAGGHARELLFQLQTEHGASSVVALVDDFKADRVVHGISVLSYEQAATRYRNNLWFIAIGDIEARANLLSKIRKDGIETGTFISSKSFIAPSAIIRPPTQIFAGTTVSDNCELAENVIVNFNCVISHDVKIGANSTLAPCAAIAGHVIVGTEVSVGVGASITNGRAGKPLIIGDRAAIGAGACVINDISPGQTVIGVPARPIERRHW